MYFPLALIAECVWDDKKEQRKEQKHKKQPV